LKKIMRPMNTKNAKPKSSNPTITDENGSMRGSHRQSDCKQITR
jgi:hypothetical protein